MECLDIYDENKKKTGKIKKTEKENENRAFFLCAGMV